MSKKFNCPDFPLDLFKPLGKAIKPHAQTFHQALNWVYSLPYKRISNLNDPSLVATEKRGTCSSKHAFLAKLAEENNYCDIQLVVGYFKFSDKNLPVFKKRFEELHTSYILEAHCYLKYNDEVIDITSTRFDPEAFFDMKNPLEIQQLTPEESGDKKQKIHEEKFKSFCSKKGIDFEKAWQLRWDIIRYLSKRGVKNLSE